MEPFLAATRVRAEDASSGFGGDLDPALQKTLDPLLVHQPAACADGQLFMSGGPQAFGVMPDGRPMGPASTARGDIQLVSKREHIASTAFSWLVPRALHRPLLDTVVEVGGQYLDECLAPPDVPGALCSTHWLPLAAAAATAPPRHALEAAVLGVAKAALRSNISALRGVTVSGLEWWLQEQWPDDKPKEIHTDKALKLVGVEPEEEEETEKQERGHSTTWHPLISSVLYLSDSGGPTAVFDQRVVQSSGSEEARPQPTLPSRVALGFPRQGSLLLFEGDLLHCVLHPPTSAGPLGTPPTEAHPRRTLLVNFWAEQPPGAIEAPLPQLPPPPPPPPPLPVPQQPHEVEVVRTHQRFERHAAEWKAQRLPSEVALKLAKLKPAAEQQLQPKLMLVEYASSGGGAQEDAAEDADGSWWWETS